MPTAPNRRKIPTTDPEWLALSDEELAGLSGQRADSEREARRASIDLHRKMVGLREQEEIARGRSILQETERPERLAVNLPDLDRVEPIIRGILLKGRLDLSDVVKVGGDNFDEMGVLFTCPLLQAACICDTLRNHDRRAGDYPTRIYLQRGPGRAWEKLAGRIVLTDVVDEKVRLNPEIFSPEPVTAERPDGGEAVLLGRKV